jgi:hypothetical protein
LPDLAGMESTVNYRKPIPEVPRQKWLFSGLCGGVTWPLDRKGCRGANQCRWIDGLRQRSIRACSGETAKRPHSMSSLSAILPAIPNKSVKPVNSSGLHARVKHNPDFAGGFGNGHLSLPAKTLTLAAIVRCHSQLNTWQRHRHAARSGLDCALLPTRAWGLLCPDCPAGLRDKAASSKTFQHPPFASPHSR